ncbi:MAG: hypothetical protein NTY68_03200 [Candidatus Micrarchaeota archaeon]|nr:hypothetical protein [Candidatus Micrarchaeota archaeon]
MIKLKNFSFGATSAVITGLAIIVGLSGMSDSNITIITALLILALADNISDSFGMHMYQRSEHIKGARKSAAMNFITRIAIVLSFVAFILLLPINYAVAASIIFGLLIITVLSYLIAKDLKIDPYFAIAKYLALAVFVMLASFYLREIIMRLAGASP